MKEPDLQLMHLEDDNGKPLSEKELELQMKRMLRERKMLIIRNWLNTIFIVFIPMFILYFYFQFSMRYIVMENVIFNYNIALKLKHFSEFPTAKVHTLFII